MTVVKSPERVGTESLVDAVDRIFQLEPFVSAFPDVLAEKRRERLARHTSYTESGSQVNWTGVLDEIFPATLSQRDGNDLSNPSAPSVFSPYMAHVIPSRDPASVKIVTTPRSTRRVSITIPGAVALMATEASTEQPAQAPAPEAGAHVQGMADPTGTLALAAAGVGVTRFGRGMGKRFGDWHAKQVEREKPYFEKVDRKPLTQIEKRKRTRLGVAFLAGAVAIGLLVGLNACNDDEPNKNPTPTPTKSSTPPSSKPPGVTDPKRSAEKPSAPKVVKPESASLAKGETIWAEAHDLLQRHGFVHNTPNTSAVTNRILQINGISEAQARSLAIGTELKLLTDTQIVDALEDYEHTTVKKIKK